MTIDPVQLLRALGSTGQAKGLQSSAGASIAGQNFDTLLQQAQAGTLSSGQSVKIAPGVQLSLTDDQQSQLTAAADQAQLTGAQRALVLVGDKAYALDVATRTITGPAPQDRGLISGFDTAISLNPADHSGGFNPLAGGARLLSQLAGAGPLGLLL
ncbi:MAG: hypothetical protein GC200_09265 [Tepidisphaera sp.]|nr:hypothetical protein [Tepidisphaera sp.]